MTKTKELAVKEKKNGLAAFHHDIEKAKTIDQFNALLNQPPNPAWVKIHQGIKYLPIERVEMLLRQIFQRWEVKVIDFKVIANSIAVHVRLRVQEPISGEWMEMDGLGAVALQLDSGAEPTDFTKIKSTAVMKNLPAAESFAIKDAAEKLGKFFGSDLNRKDDIVFAPAYNRWENGEGVSQ